MIFFVLFSLFLIGSVSAADWDNKLTYSKNDLKVEFSNSLLLLFKTSEIGTAELKSHKSVDEIRKVGAGTQVVMWYDFDFLGLYENGLGEVEFTDMKTGKTIERNYSFVYWGEESYEVPTYSEKVLKNGTIVYEQIGTETKTREAWLPYNSKDIPKGNIRIGLQTYVEIDDKVDGVWTIAGKRVKKHAGWTSSLNVDLISYWKLDGDVKDELGANDGTNSGSANVTGKIGYARDFEQTEGDYVDVGNNTVDITTSNMTINMWIKPESLAAHLRIFGPGTNGGYGFHIDAEGNLWFGKVGTTDKESTDTISAGSWQMVTVVYDQSADLVYFYINSNVDSGGALSLTSTFSSDITYYIAEGSPVGGGYSFDGIIDEIGLWERCLTSTEITQLYNGGAGITYVPSSNLYVNLNEPANDVTIYKPTMDFNCTAFDDNGITNVSLVVNGSIVDTNSSGYNNTLVNFNYNLGSPGFYNWTCWAYDDEDNLNNSAEVRNITYSNDLSIALNAPPIMANISSIPFGLNGTASDDTAVVNVSLIINATYNGTDTSGVNNTLYNFDRSLVDGFYNWTMEVCDAVSCINATAWNFTIDTTPPEINVSFPNETITFHQKNTNLSLNWTVTDDNLDSCWYDWNGTNVSVTCGDNSTAFNITNGTNKNLIFYANDTFGHETSQIVTWNYRLFLENETFTTTLLEGSASTFRAAFFTNGSDITIANLSYNNSGNTGEITTDGGNTFIVTRTRAAPSVDADTNFSFYWNITQGTMYYALDEKNQTVLNLEIDDCSVNSNVLYNFTIVDEKTQTKLNGVGNNTEGKVDIRIYGVGTTTLIEQFNKSYSQINPFAVCFNSTSGEFNADAQIQYGADGYETEFYHIQNTTINSSSFPTNITLFDLNSSDSQLFKLVIKDSSFLAIDDALVEIYRKYIDEGVSKIVEIPKTDGKGETAAHLVLQDAIYKFIIKKYGTTIATFEDVVAVCQTPLVTPCVIDFNAFAETLTVPDFEETEDFLFTLGFNESSREILSEFTIPSGEPHEITLQVIKEDALGTSVCTDTLTSASGTLRCSVGGNIGNMTVLGRLYKDGELQAQGPLKLDQNPIDIYGGVLVIIGLLIMMTLIGAGISDNPIYTVLFLMVGVILLFALNLVANNGFIGGTATILWLVVAVILLIIKGGRRS
ncbi:MAG: LamG domain-containing protein [Candidatus Heimdallarchaeota archaeon]